MDAALGHCTARARAVWPGPAVTRPRPRGCVGLVSITAGGGGRRPVRPHRQHDRLREQQAGHARRAQWDIDGAGDARHPGLRHRHQRRTSAAEVDFKIDTTRPGLHASTSTASATTAVTAPARSPRSPRRRTLPQTQPQCITDADHRAVRLRQLGASPRPGTSRRPPSPASTSPGSAAPTTATPATSPSSSATTPARSDVVFQTSDPTWQAYNDYGGSDFYTGGANGRAYKLSYNRPVQHPRRPAAAATSSSPTSTRWCGSWSATATTSATSPASTPTVAARC